MLVILDCEDLLTKKVDINQNQLHSVCKLPQNKKYLSDHVQSKVLLSGLFSGRQFEHFSSCSCVVLSVVLTADCGNLIYCGW